MKKLYMVGNIACEHDESGGIISLLLLQQEIGIHGSEQHLHLMQDAVLVAKKGNSQESKLYALKSGGTTITIQKEDAAARGVHEVIEGSTLIDYPLLVDLIFTSDKICTSL